MNDTIHTVSEIEDNGFKFLVRCSCGWVYKHNNEGNVVYYRAEHIKFFANFNKTERERWLDKIKADDNTYRMLGQGASRDVYRLDHDRVIKIERHVDGNAWRGVNQCNREVETWNNATPEVKPYLATILESGDGWVIMERARGTLAKMCEGTEISKTIRHDLYKTTGFNDLHEGNIGYFGNGVFKILDYAL